MNLSPEADGERTGVLFLLAALATESAEPVVTGERTAVTLSSLYNLL